MNIFEPNVFIPCCGEHGGVCTCNQIERVIRAYASGNYAVPMDDRERQWCLNKAYGKVHAAYQQSAEAKLSDSELAKLVLKTCDQFAMTI